VLTILLSKSWKNIWAIQVRAMHWPSEYHIWVVFLQVAFQFSSKERPDSFGIQVLPYSNSASVLITYIFSYLWTSGIFPPRQLIGWACKSNLSGQLVGQIFRHTGGKHPQGAPFPGVAIGKCLPGPHAAHAAPGGLCRSHPHPVQEYRGNLTLVSSRILK
jgi:hypothetical protein